MSPEGTTTKPGVIQRRTLLGAGAAIAASAALPRLARTQTSEGELAAQPLRDGLTMILGAGANVVVTTGPSGVLVTDGGLPERSSALLEFIDAVTDQPRIEHLFNANWRPEHTGLNATAHTVGAPIHAHVNTWLWLQNDFDVPWEGRHYAPRPASELPTETFYKSGRLDHGGRRIEYGYLPQAHTDGDIYLHFPNENLLVVSDLLAVGTYPIVDAVTGGWIGGLEQATAALLELCDAETLVIPADGPVARRADLEAQLEFAAAMKNDVGGLIKNGKSLEEVIAARPTAAFDDRLSGDVELFLELTYKGLWGHIRELGGVL